MTWEEMLQQTGKEPVKRHVKHHEDNLQIQCMTWLRLQHPQIYDMTIHIPNGGARNKAEGAIFKRMGVKAGFPDLFVFMPKHPWHGLAIEMKTTQRGSTQRPNQKEWQQRLTNEGYQYHIARTLDEFQNIITDYIKAPQPQ